MAIEVEGGHITEWRYTNNERNFVNEDGEILKSFHVSQFDYNAKLHCNSIEMMCLCMQANMEEAIYREKENLLLTQRPAFPVPFKDKNNERMYWIEKFWKVRNDYWKENHK